MKNNKTGKLLFALSIVFGAAAGILRAFELANVFDNETQLMEAWHPATIILLALCGVFAVIAIVLSAKSARYESGKAVQPSAAWMGVETVACGLLAFSCIYELIKLREAFHAILLVFNLLGVISAISILVASYYTWRGVLTVNTGFYYTIPVFWCCFALVLDFWGHSSNPVLLSFAFTMFALIFCALAIHTVAGYFFEKPKQRRAVAYCALGLFFALFSMISLLIYPYFEEAGTVFVTAAETTPTNLSRLGFMILHVGGLFYAVLAGAFRKPAEAPLPAVPVAASAEDEFSDTPDVEQVNGSFGEAPEDEDGDGADTETKSEGGDDTGESSEK